MAFNYYMCGRCVCFWICCVSCVSFFSIEVALAVFCSNKLWTFSCLCMFYDQQRLVVINCTLEHAANDDCEVCVFFFCRLWYIHIYPVNKNNKFQKKKTAVADSSFWASNNNKNHSYQKFKLLSTADIAEGR